MRSTGAYARRETRRPVTAGCHLLRSNGATLIVSLRDLSYDGCCVALDEQLADGEQVKLTVSGTGEVVAEVRWCRDGLCGLHFLAEQPEKVRVQRAEARVETAASVILRRLGRTPFRVNVDDMSSKGCRVQLVERPSVGDQLTIKFDGLDQLDCHAKWVEGYVAGLEFDRPIHPAVFDILKARLAD